MACLAHNTNRRCSVLAARKTRLPGRVLVGQSRGVAMGTQGHLADQAVCTHSSHRLLMSQSSPEFPVCGHASAVAGLQASCLPACNRPGAISLARFPDQVRRAGRETCRCSGVLNCNKRCSTHSQRLLEPKPSLPRREGSRLPGEQVPWPAPLRSGFCGKARLSMHE